MWTVCQATPGDEAQVQRLIEQAERVTMHFHSRDLANYLTRQPFLLAKNAGRLRGFLSFLTSRPLRATLIAAGLADDWAILSWLDRLLPRCIAHLRARGVTSLSYVGAVAWLVEPLKRRGFHLVSHIVAYEKRGGAVPEGGNQAVRVRPVRAADLAALVAVDSVNFHPLWHNSVETLRRWRECLPYFVVAVAEEEPVGYCHCSVKAGQGHLIRIAVHPAWQGQGVGTRLMAETMQFFQLLGVQLITLNTQEENEVAQRLYRKFGFRSRGREALALWMEL